MAYNTQPTYTKENPPEDGWYPHREERNTYPITELRLKQIQEKIVTEQCIPTVPDVMEITGLKYDRAAELRRRAIREFPIIDMEELGEEVKKLLIARVRSGEIENVDLVRLMPYIAEQKGSKADIKQEITHRFIVLKPDEKLPSEE